MRRFRDFQISLRYVFCEFLSSMYVPVTGAGFTNLLSSDPSMKLDKALSQMILRIKVTLDRLLQVSVHWYFQFRLRVSA